MRRVIVTLLLTALQGAAQSPCDCNDKEILKERIKLASAAIEAYGHEIIKIGMRPCTAKERAALQSRVGKFMGGARTPGMPEVVANGGTDNFCRIHVDAPTKCLEAAIRAHEKVHQDACQNTFANHELAILRGKGIERFEALGWNISSYIMEEITGYQTEIQFLTKELIRLNRDCDSHPVPGPIRDYSSRDHSPIDTGGRPSATETHNLQRPRPITAPPLVKPKPIQPPPPIK